MKFIRDYDQPFSAWVVCNRKGKVVSKIQRRFISAGQQGWSCQIDCYDVDDNGICSLNHRGHAKGGGYDLTTAAMQGMMVDGHTIYDHSSYLELDISPRKQRELLKAVETTAPGLRVLLDKYGVTASTDRDGKPVLRPIGGLDRLHAMGYRVMKVL